LVLPAAAHAVKEPAPGLTAIPVAASPGFCMVAIMIEFAVHAVVLIVTPTVPFKDATPADADPALVPDAVTLTLNLPAVAVVNADIDVPDEMYVRALILAPPAIEPNVDRLPATNAEPSVDVFPTTNALPATVR